MTIHRLHFAHLPTPIEPLPRLSAALGGLRLFIKRDDQTGLALGGNKTRKLEFLVAAARAEGARTLVTAGAWQSNHCRQTAAAAARFGLDCTLILAGPPPAEATGNLLLDHLLGADIVPVADRGDRDLVLQRTGEELAARGRAPYVIPVGGSSPTGALGYCFAVEEALAQQVPVAGGVFDWMVFCTSSSGTHAGLVLGQRVFGYGGQVLGISNDHPATWVQAQVAALASAASEKLGPRIDFSPADVRVNDDYCAAGYGVLTAAEREAIALFASLEGILLDPVYTGRAAAGLIDLIRQGFFEPSARVLFWHTGGQAALFASDYQAALV